MQSNLVAFMHIATMGKYQEVVDELVSVMADGGLRDALRETHFCIVGAGRVSLPDGPKVKIHRMTENLRAYEFPTIKLLHAHAQMFPTDNFCYFHTKGVAHDDNPAITDWRRYMAYFVLAKWEEATKALEWADTAGVDFGFYHARGMGCVSTGDSERHGEAITFGVLPHYSGNFWWAKGSYLVKLPPANNTKDRHECEFWIGFGRGVHACLWHSGIPIMRRHEMRYPPQAYIA